MQDAYTKAQGSIFGICPKSRGFGAFFLGARKGIFKMSSFFSQTKKRCKILALMLLNAYQRVLSPFLPKACRFYPSCSEYARWRIKNQPLLPACYSIFLRILRCNQLNDGGIDYPVIKKRIAPGFYPLLKIDFWLIPLARYSFKFDSVYFCSKFLVIKSFKEIE